MDYWLKVNDETLGPLDVASVKELQEIGYVTPDTDCRRGDGPWQRVKSFRELFVPAPPPSPSEAAAVEVIPSSTFQPSPLIRVPKTKRQKPKKARQPTPPKLPRKGIVSKIAMCAFVFGKVTQILGLTLAVPVPLGILLIAPHLEDGAIIAFCSMGFLIGALLFGVGRAVSSIAT